MSTAEQIEQAILQLSPEERAKLDAWYAAQQAAAWDQQIEADSLAGRLDHLIEEGRAAFRDGRCTEL